MLLFAIVRLVTVAAYAHRGIDWLAPGLDPAGYVATADYVAAHGVIPTEPLPQYRQFPGLSFLMAAINPIVGNMPLSGNLVVVTSAVLMLLLIQHLFNDFRLSLLSIVVLPYTVVNTAIILSETPTILCFLIGIWVLRDHREKPVIFFLGLLAMGYGTVIRESAVIYIYPVAFLLAWLLPGGNLRRAVLASLVVSIPLLAYSAFNWITIHQFFPQYKLHQMLFHRKLSLLDPNRYSSSMIDFPFRSLWVALGDPHGPLIKKASISFAVLVTFVAVYFLFRRARQEPEATNRTLALAFAVGATLHIVLYASFGGDFGYRWLDRHLCEIDPMIAWALFYRQPLRWIWVAAAIVIGIVAGISAGTTGTRGLFS